METLKVGMREFRAGLADFLVESQPVEVTRHGETLGVYIPTRTLADRKKAIHKLGQKLDEELKGVNIEALIDEINNEIALSKRRNRKVSKAP